MYLILLMIKFGIFIVIYGLCILKYLLNEDEKFVYWELDIYILLFMI